MKKLMILGMFLLSIILHANAQSGAISGKILDEKKDAILGVIIEVSQNGKLKGGTTSDEDGKYTVKSLPPGRYYLKAMYTSYKTVVVKDILVSPDKTTKVDVNMELDSKQLSEVAVIAYKVPLIGHDERKTITSEEIERMPTRQTNSVVSTGAGVYQSKAGALVKYYNPSNESYKKERENDFMNVANSPLSTMSIDVDRASYSNVRRFINDGQMPPPDAVRVEEMINYFEYQYPQPENNEPFAIVTQVTDCPWKAGHKILHIGMQARTISTDNLPPSNLVFLIDVSGSMNEEAKLPLVKTALKMLTSQLRAQDKISIVVYAGNAGLVLPATSGSNKRAIYDALDRLEAGGSTAGGAGIKLAYDIAMQNFVKGGNNRVLLATDGDFNVGVSGDNELEELITKERQKGIYLTCLGFGTGNYKDSKMEVMADKGNGNYAYIDNAKEAQKTLIKEFGGTIFTLAKDVKAQIEFNPAYVQSYRLVGYENRLLNAEDFKDDKKDAGDMGSGHSVTIMYEIIPAGVTDTDVRNTIPLKYQNSIYPSGADYIRSSNELATIKFRYKKPNGNTSKEITHIINNTTIPLQRADENVRFATSVAMFGMLLKNAEHKGTSSYNKVLALARNSKSFDKDGNRSEFIQLVNKVNKSGDELAGWFEQE